MVETQNKDIFDKGKNDAESILKEKEITGFSSAEGDYFLITMQKKDVYYLKNKYTEIPNEFGIYSMKALEELFKDLRKCISVSDPAEIPGGHPNSCFYVLYEDGTKQLFRQKEDSKINVCHNVSSVAHYSELFPDDLWISELVTIDHLRSVCESGTEAYDVFVQAVSHMIQDGETAVSEQINEDSSIDLNMDVLGRQYPFIKIRADGLIESDGNMASRLEYVRILKEKGVRIKRLNSIGY
ncbi:MAG: hypothetical protein K6E85_17475 [Lachnospiraceae bacterium]|nr:hypothetical protein [Lachnospiraceae bacterium]